MVRPGGTRRDQRVGAERLRFSEEALQLANLVASVDLVREVVALHPQLAARSTA